MVIYGVIVKQYEGARNHKYIEYEFQTGNIKYNGSVPLTFFKYCNYSCCNVGDTVLVRYLRNNPKNNDLVPN